MNEMYIDPKQNKQNDLTEKQKLFCLEYLVDFNATKAAIRAGYSEHSARSIASENLTKPDIIKFIQITSDRCFSVIGLKQERIMHELVTIAFDQGTPLNFKIRALELLLNRINESKNEPSNQNHELYLARVKEALKRLRGNC